MVVPYGLVVLSGKSSLLGKLFGFPYTVALEENIMFLQLNSFMTSSNTSVELMLLS